jgi:hypothetical protein
VISAFILVTALLLFCVDLSQQWDFALQHTDLPGYAVAGELGLGHISANQMYQTLNMKIFSAVSTK